MSTDLSFLSRLEDIIQARIDNPTPESYVAQLLARGDKRIAQKLGEEAIELALASVAGDRQERLDEAADLVFHLLVLLKTNNLSLEDVSVALQQRSKSSPDS